MQYLGTNICLTLGAMRLRFSFALEDAPDEVQPAAPAPAAQAGPAAAPRASFDRVHSN